VRAYHLVPIEYGLQNLKDGHLKVAEFADLNDPFELLSIELSDKAVRRRFLKWNESRFGVWHPLFQPALDESGSLEPLCVQAHRTLPGVRRS